MSVFKLRFKSTHRLFKKQIDTKLIPSTALTLQVITM